MCANNAQIMISTKKTLFEGTNIVKNIYDAQIKGHPVLVQKKLPFGSAVVCVFSI